MTIVRNQFSELLKEKEQREDREITLVEVSEKTGLTRKTIYAWKDNVIQRYDRDVIFKLCQYFECMPGDLIKLV